MLSAVLVRYVRMARELGAREVIVVGTEPLRAAADAETVTSSVAKAIGTSLHVLGHEDEGLLTLVGVTEGRRPRTDLLVADVGGGSTELVEAGPRHRPKATGVRLGSARLTTRHVRHDPPTREEIEALRAAARSEVEVTPEASPEEIVAVGGTATNLIKIVPLAVMADRSLTRTMIEEALGLLVEHPSADVSEAYGVSPTRAAILPAGAAILEAILDRFASDRATVIDTGIREGLVYVASRGGDRWLDALPDLAAGWRN
jgi:exopolyphosphatase/guanosine-5'-triphosphate,3'-diphosphate pyrophosphatase